MKNKEVAQKVADKQKRPLWIGETLYKGLSDAAAAYNVTSQAIFYWLQRGYSVDQKVCYYDGEEKPAKQL